MEQVVTVQETGALTGHRRQPEGASISWLKQGYTENRAAPPMDRNKLQRTEWSYKSGLSEGHDFVDTGATPYLLTAGFTYVLTLCASPRLACEARGCLNKQSQHVRAFARKLFPPIKRRVWGCCFTPNIFRTNPACTRESAMPRELW
eukprot:scaffold137900_cov17-Tisochrysis_lutea.AAC.1